MNNKANNCLTFEKIAEIKDFMDNKTNKIMVVNHRKMDGDAIGSAYAFGKVGEKKGKEVRYFSEDLPSSDFDFLNMDIKFETKVPKDYKPDVIVCLDTAGIEQLGSIYTENKKLFEKTKVFVIDHHYSNPCFGDYNVVFTNKSSTCEIVYDLLFEHDCEQYVDEQMATMLLMGIITDTNSFFNTNSSSRAMEVAGLLMGYGARHQDIILNLFKKKPFNRLKLWGKLLEGIKQSEDGKYVWTTITNDLFLSTKTTTDDTSGFIDEFLSTINGAKVVFLLYELGGNKIKGSFRSRDDNYNVYKFCELFGGGGHPRASGFTKEKTSIYELETEVLGKLKEFFN
ncbi:MAG: bifunctional oligoribonuclease/PAP phosphatase NrnA [Candidatus Gracilibacteria bacterium]|nr:bifunctional oligoribonuclease/PAP phosphatase NrnA [Candidatus Gracilibacteria bacterium]